MKLFVYESMSAGACEALVQNSSLVEEGTAMLRSLIEDFLNLSLLIDGSRIEIRTIWSHSLGPHPFTESDRLEVMHSVDEASEQQLFSTCCRECEAALIVAPECDQMLFDRCQMALNAGLSLFNCHLDTIALCADKRALAEHCTLNGIECIDSFWSRNGRNPPDQVVVKPRFGAGSVGIEVLSSSQLLDREIDSEIHLVQPLIPGRAFSVAVFFNEQSQVVARLPSARQILSEEGTFSYLGGEIPASGVNESLVNRMLQKIQQNIAGLRGYVGVDFLIPDEKEIPVLVEINPRLTTSYVGYRKATETNLAEYFFPFEFNPSPCWNRTVHFTPNGTVRTEGI